MKKAFVASAAVVLVAGAYCVVSGPSGKVSAPKMSVSESLDQSRAPQARQHRRPDPTMPLSGAHQPAEARAPVGTAHADPEKVRANLEKMLSASAPSGGLHSERGAPRAPNSAEQRNAATTAGAIAPAEARMLAAYEQMMVALDEADGNCDEMSHAVLEIAKDNRQTTADLAASWSTLTPEQRGLEEQRIEREMGGRVDAIRQAFRRGLARCPNSANLMAAFRLLADPNEP